MKIEYLLEGSPDCPLVRLFSAESPQLHDLLSVFADLAGGRSQTVELLDIPGFEGVNLSGFRLRSSGKAEGVTMKGSQCIWSESPERWDDIYNLLVPFANPSSSASGRYQWLRQGKLRILFCDSHEGCW